MNPCPNTQTNSSVVAAQSLLTPHYPANRILRLKQVVEMTGLSRSAIYDRLDPKSRRYDPKFPKQVKLGTSSHSAVGWREADILLWIHQCCSAS